MPRACLTVCCNAIARVTGIGPLCQMTTRRQGAGGAAGDRTWPEELLRLMDPALTWQWI